jgi:hypothetical protein
MEVKIEKLKLYYNGNQVIARKLTVSSKMLINCDKAWEKLQKCELLEFVCKPKVKFKPNGGQFPNSWNVLETVSTKMLIFGFIPFGGTHTLYFEKIDAENKILQTREWDDAAKIWNHKISLKTLTTNSIYYEDEIVIYGGMLTGIITAWAKSFYKHRQKRWQLIVKNNIQFK